MHELLSYGLIFILAIFTSTASAMVGLGGGLLLIPLIILIFGLPVKYVAGTMLLAMVPYTAVATLRNFHRGYVNFRIGLVMEIGSIAGVTAGAHLSTLIPNLGLKILFLLIVLYLTITLNIPNDSPYNYVARAFKIMNHYPPFLRQKVGETTLVSMPALVSIGIVAGLFSGMLGIGGGFLKTPVLIVGIGLPSKIAVGTALFMILITAASGSVWHIYLGHVYYPIALTVAAGMMLGAYWGTGFLKNMPEEKVKKYIFFALVAAGLLSLFR